MVILTQFRRQVLAYGDGVGRLREALGIRLIDVAAALTVLAAVEIGVATGAGRAPPARA